MKYFAKTLFITCILFSGLFSVSAQTVTQIRKVEGFTSINVRSGIDLYLKQGSVEKVTIVANEDKIDEIKTVLKNGVLEIYIDRSSGSGFFNWNKQNAKAYVTVKDLKELQGTGGSDIFTESKLDLIKLSLKVAGGSDAKLDLDADELSCEATGGSDVTLTGSAAVFKAHSTGGSDLKAKDFKSNFCQVTSTGGSDAYVYASKEISISATGGSDVYYWGGARVVSSKSSGGSDIHRK